MNESTLIKLAFLHQAITWPGVCGSETSLSSTKIPGLKMSLEPNGLLLDVKGQKATVSLANVVIAIHE